jgi:DHA2 family methylenomycin A resistance protein-like MFS transporter
MRAVPDHLCIPGQYCARESDCIVGSRGGVALVLGPLVGGLLLSVFDWRSIFLVHVPICLVGVWLTLKMDGQTGDHGCRRLDLSGQLSAACAMILLIAALIEGREFG